MVAGVGEKQLGVGRDVGFPSLSTTLLEVAPSPTASQHVRALFHTSLLFQYLDGPRIVKRMNGDLNCAAVLELQMTQRLQLFGTTL